MFSQTPALTGAMRALRLDKANSLSLTSISIPHPPANHLLVQVYASAIQPSDILNAHGGFAVTTFPRVVGRDFSGVIAAVGEGSPSTLIGEPVFGTSGSTHAFTVDGFQAEYAIVPFEGVALKPEGISHVQAATLGVPISTAALIVRRAAIQNGERVLVLGAKGAVGSAVCTILGPDVHVLKGIRGPGGDVDTAADPQLKTVGKVDVVIDTIGITALSEAALDILSKSGRFVFISAPKNVTTPQLTIKMKDFYRNELSLLGVNSVSKSIEEMAILLGGIKGPVLEDYVNGAGRWTEISLDEAVIAYEDKTPGKKYVIKII
ncbi:MAG: hypothetical protein GOMPHAMPRED_001532 [Gomphillus americanus]|uniref:Enoyl reductase (ER) domain-containing protein n=1 Tax=Gomphillus americanus TaxID=1940652 RepID=A0A8H3IF48_9LECA|nr:MAG: hypothetical protein GOMPHAMPRED_001532 [Gomphillus americanus]